MSTAKRLWIILPACTPGGIITNGEPQPKINNQANTKTFDGFHASLFPNPTGNEFNLQVSSKSSESIEATLFDVQGRFIKKMKIKANEVNQFGHELKTGLYMIEIKQNDQSTMLKAIKF
jgi:hypothetical protein